MTGDRNPLVCGNGGRHADQDPDRPVPRDRRHRRARHPERGRGAPPAPGHRRIRRTRPRRDGAQRDLRPRGQPHAGQPARPPHQDGASASSGIRAPGAPSEDPRRAAGPVGTGHPLRHREAQPEVRRLRRAGGMAPGLGVLSAHQRRPRRGRRDVRRHGDGERPADDRARQPSRSDPRPPHRRHLLRRDGSRRTTMWTTTRRSRSPAAPARSPCTTCARSTAPRRTSPTTTAACCCSSSAPPMPGRCSASPPASRSSRS